MGASKKRTSKISMIQGTVHSTVSNDRRQREHFRGGASFAVVGTTPTRVAVHDFCD